MSFRFREGDVLACEQRRQTLLSEFYLFFFFFFFGFKELSGFVTGEN